MPLNIHPTRIIRPLLLCALVSLCACAGKEGLPLGDTGQSFNEFRQNWNGKAEAAGLPRIPGERSSESVLGGGNMKNTYNLAEGMALDVWWTRKDKDLILSSLSLRIAADRRLMTEYSVNGAKLFVECILAGQERDSAAIVAQMNLDELMGKENGQSLSVSAGGAEFVAWFKQNWGLNISCAFKQNGPDRTD